MKFGTRDIVLIGAFAALAALSAILVRFGGEAIVPFSPMPFVALVSGLMLGSRRGAAAMGVYVLIGLVGVPVFASPPFGGPQYVLQPTFGFLLGFIGAAYVAGRILESAGPEQPGIGRYLAASFAGLLLIYIVGLFYLWLIFNFVMGAGTLAKIGMTRPISVTTVLAIGFLPFIAFDIVKAILAAIMARLVGERVAVALPRAS